MFRFKGTALTEKHVKIMFQYILCFGSRIRWWRLHWNCKRVSIHPMFRFKNIIRHFVSSNPFVSIHPMFRFKFIPGEYRSFYKSFNTSYVSVQAKTILKRGLESLFQYILCFGSSYDNELYLNIYNGFNTSYVSVQVIALNNPIIAVFGFQYILCFGSRQL